MAYGPTSRVPWTSRLRRPTFVLAGVFSALISLGSVASFGYLVYLQSRIDHAEIDPLPDALNGPQTVLVLGSDSRAGLPPEEQEVKGSQDDVGGQRADTIILMRIEPGTGRTVVLHFPRDLRVPIHGTGEENKINTAFEGGPQRMIDTIEDFSGLTINHYVEVDFGGFREIVDSLGGVPICVDRPLIDEVAELYLPEPGCYLLGGKMALAFVRARNVEGDIIPDFSRIARQQQFLRAVLNSVLAPGSILSLPSLAGAVIDNLTVDRGISVIEIGDIARGLRGLGTPKVDFRVVPSTPILIDGISYLDPVDDQARRLFSLLEAGRPLGGLGLEIAQYADQRADVSVRVADAGGDWETVRERLAGGGFELLGTVAPTDAASESKVLFASGQDAEAALVAKFLGGLFRFPAPLPVEEAAKGSLQGADVMVVVAPDFGEPIRRA